jgi:predicted aspartyl protease
MARLGDHSRRRLLAYGASAIALAPSLARAASATPPSPQSSTIEGSQDTSDRLTLPTLIDGKGPYPFVVDTGADRSVIASDVAASLGLQQTHDIIVQGITRALPMPTVRLKNLSFGNIVIDTLNTPILPREWLGAAGYLGLDAIAGRRVTFDFLHHKLTVAYSGNSTDWVRPNEVVVRVDGANGRLKAVDCRVEGVPAYAFVDSGAQISICNTCLFSELQKNGASYLKNITIPLLGVTGGQVLGQVTSISDIRLGGLAILRSTLAVSDLDVFNQWGLSDKPALFLGMNFLRQTSTFTIDYRHKELRFKLASHITQTGRKPEFAGGAFNNERA